MQGTQPMSNFAEVGSIGINKQKTQRITEAKDKNIVVNISLILFDSVLYGWTLISVTVKIISTKE